MWREPVLPGQSESPLLWWTYPGHGTGKAKSSQQLHSPTPRLLEFRPRAWAAVGSTLWSAQRSSREAKGEGLLRTQSPHSAALPGEAVAPRPLNLAAAHTEGLSKVSSVIANSPRRKKNPVLHFYYWAADLLQKHPQALTKCPLGLVPEKALPISHFVRACRGMCATKHSRSQNVPLQENESRSIWFSLFVQSFSLEPTSSETHTHKVETVSLTDWKTSTRSH